MSHRGWKALLLLVAAPASCLREPLECLTCPATGRWCSSRCQVMNPLLTRERSACLAHQLGFSTDERTHRQFSLPVTGGRDELCWGTWCLTCVVSAAHAGRRPLVQACDDLHCKCLSAVKHCCCCAVHPPPPTHTPLLSNPYRETWIVMDLMDRGTLASAVRRGMFVVDGTLRPVSQPCQGLWHNVVFSL